MSRAGCCARNPEQIDFDWGAGWHVSVVAAPFRLPLELRICSPSTTSWAGWREPAKWWWQRRKLGTYQLELLGKGMAGYAGRPDLDAALLARGETTTEVWLAAEQYLLPVKIQHIDKGVSALRRSPVRSH